MAVWGLSTLPIAVILYWLRRAHRFYYGVFELIVALCFLYFVLAGMVFGEASRIFSVGLVFNRTVTLFAVVYFLVRALDNIGEGIRPGTFLEDRWNLLFPKPPK